MEEDSGQCITYRELSEMGEKVKEAAGHRCLVFLYCRNEIGSVAGYAAFIHSGIVPVLLNASLDQDLNERLIREYLPVYIWTPADKKAEFLKPGRKTEEVFSAYHYVLLKTGFEKEYSLHEDLCLLLTTSGSTGSPKFVRQSYENVRANADSIVKYLELDASERPVSTLPMNYTYGLSIINSHFMVGATLLLTEKGLMQKEFWNFFKEKKATSFGGVPYTYEMLDRLRFYRMDLPALRYMTQAGGKITPELHRRFAEYAKEKEKKFIVMYGQCEATARMGYLPAEKALEKCGSMGIAIPGGRFHLIDENGKDVKEANTTGELVYEGANVTLGYAECGEDLIRGDERNGILQTGDMAQFDEDGYYYIVGRRKRFLKIYGNRVNLDEVDRLVKTEFENIEFASSGTDDHMYLFLTQEALAERVRDYVIRKTKLNPAAFQTVVLDEIPKNDAGKTLYKELAVYFDKNR